MKTKGLEQSNQKTKLQILLDEIEEAERELDELLAQDREREAQREAEKRRHRPSADDEIDDMAAWLEDTFKAADTGDEAVTADNEANTENDSWTPTAVIHNTEFVPAGVSKGSHELIHSELKAGRRHFGSPAATIDQSDFEDTKEVAGHAERLTSQHILDWIDSRQIGNAVLVDSVSIPGLSDKDTDHLLVLGNTVLVVDTKAYASGYNYKFKNKEYFGGPTVVLKAHRRFRDHNGVCRPSSFKHHGGVGMNSILGIWRRYLVEEASVMGAVYINSDDTAVQRNEEWFKVFPLLDRESLWNYLDRLYHHSKQEVHAENGSKVGKQINLALVSQVIVGATKPSKASLRDFTKQLKSDAAASTPEMQELERELREFGSSDHIPKPGTVHAHYHIAKSSWTMKLCEDCSCELLSFSYEEARKHIHYSGEKWWGIGSDYWVTRNTYAAGVTYGGQTFKGGNEGRGKLRYERLGELKLHLLTGRIGKYRYDTMLNNMLHKNPTVGPREFDSGQDFLEQRDTLLRKKYRKQDRLTPSAEDEQSGLLVVSSLHADWDENLDTIVSESVDMLTEQGHTLNSYQDNRNNRDQKPKKTH